MLGSPPGLPSTVRTSPDTHYIMTLLPQRQEERFFGGFCVCVWWMRCCCTAECLLQSRQRACLCKTELGEGRGRESRLILKPIWRPQHQKHLPHTSCHLDALGLFHGSLTTPGRSQPRLSELERPQVGDGSSLSSSTAVSSSSLSPVCSVCSMCPVFHPRPSSLPFYTLLCCPKTSPLFGWTPSPDIQPSCSAVLLSRAPRECKHHESKDGHLLFSAMPPAPGTASGP